VIVLNALATVPTDRTVARPSSHEAGPESP